MIENPEIMKMASKMSLEQATLSISKLARQMAKDIPSDMSGHDALIAFANAIESTNAKQWPVVRIEE